jgi:hypothetical protein
MNIRECLLEFREMHARQLSYIDFMLRVLDGGLHENK